MATESTMATIMSSKSKFMMYNSMCCLLKALEGKYVTVELRNDIVIRGKLDSVEGTMSLNMSNTILTNVRGIKTHLAKFFVHGRQIQYVQIPDEVDIIKAMRFELSKRRIHREKERSDQKRIFQRKQNIKMKKQMKMDRKGHQSQRFQDKQ